jgi:hypothetical protein
MEDARRAERPYHSDEIVALMMTQAHWQILSRDSLQLIKNAQSTINHNQIAAAHSAAGCGTFI